MYAMWLFLKEKGNCGGKLMDVHRPAKAVEDRGYRVERENSAKELLLRTENTRDGVIFRRNYNRKRFHELNIGNPSRNIIEMIFRTASVRSSKHARKIERVLRVKNSMETLERFEEYREMVKKRACGQYWMHPRSVVDGNELLRFYDTTINCCSRKTNKVSEVCLNSMCAVCRMIQSGFDMDATKKNGIRLSTSSETFCRDMVAVPKGEKVKRAVVVCRVIAGKVDNMVDGSEEGFDSVGSGRLGSKSEHLLVRNPSAVLPCFVIVCG
ncbi:hypothetical protein HHK36_005773 [Tetracentron sinense]|uniref:Uncharacterized protein n=1 Tax=Tetracentron sinense TaxID=13715 RepID=A0A834ZL56_TETSI|nr:hypothetical protein HHK36_005773 [Tetracentron sinense]